MPAEIKITTITVPDDIIGGSAFNIDVGVTTDLDTFNEGVAYKLVLFVNSQAHGLLVPPITQLGSVGQAPWNNQTDTLSFPVTSQAGPDDYVIKATLAEGTHGLKGTEHLTSSDIVVL